MVITKKGLRRNGSLRYTIRPIQEAVELYHQRQLMHAAEETEKARIRKRLEQLEQERLEEMKGRIA